MNIKKYFSIFVLISIVQESSTGAIVAKGNLTIVGLPDEFF